jgi:hypothetical protein
VHKTEQLVQAELGDHGLILLVLQNQHCLPKDVWLKQVLLLAQQAEQAEQV